MSASLYPYIPARTDLGRRQKSSCAPNLMSAEPLGVVQVADSGVVTGWVSEVLGAHAAEVTRYRSGETKLLQFFVGQVMKASRGKADPKLAQRVLEERLTS